MAITTKKLQNLLCFHFMLNNLGAFIQPTNAGSWPTFANKLQVVPTVCLNDWLVLQEFET